VPQTRAALAELTRLNLITELQPARYGFHDLLRAYAAELITMSDGPDVRHTAMLRMLDHYLHTSYAADQLLTRRRALITLPAAQSGAAPQEPESHQQALAWFTAEYSVLLAIVERARAAGFHGHSWRLAATLTTFLDLQVHWQSLATAQTTALDAAQHQADRTGQAGAHRSLGLAYDRLGHPEDARSHYLLALQLFGELGNNAGQARTHQHLARLAGAQGHHHQALGHARDSLDHYRAANDRGGQSAALNHLGWFHAQLGEHHRALSHCQQALALAQETKDLGGQAHTWDSLGYIHHHLGQYEQAVSCYRHALRLFRVTGDRHSEATGLAYLGDTYHSGHEPAAAQDAWRQALAIFAELDHPDGGALRARILELTAAAETV
jgi:tetratricopeptide (TPR) repeat protein